MHSVAINMHASIQYSGADVFKSELNIDTSQQSRDDDADKKVKLKKIDWKLDDDKEKSRNTTWL